MREHKLTVKTYWDNEKIQRLKSNNLFVNNRKKNGDFLFYATSDIYWKE